MISATLSVNVTGLGDPITSSLVLTGGGSSIVRESITAEATDQELAFSFPVTGLVGVVMVSDRALTVKTNSSGAPQETLALAAGKPFVYLPAAGVTAQFAGAVTKVFVTLAAGADSPVSFLAVYDPTP